MDFRASIHFSGDRSSFTTIDFSYQKSVTLVGSQSHYIEGQEVAKVVYLKGEIKSIYDVQYIPRLYRDILSVGKIANLGHIDLFDQSSCFVISKEKYGKKHTFVGSCLYRTTQLEPRFLSPSTCSWKFAKHPNFRFTTAQKL